MPSQRSFNFAIILNLCSFAGNYYLPSTVIWGVCVKIFYNFCIIKMPDFHQNCKFSFKSESNFGLEIPNTFAVLLLFPSILFNTSLAYSFSSDLKSTEL